VGQQAERLSGFLADPSLRRHSLARFPLRRSGGKGIPVVSNVKQPMPRILAAPTAPELCQSETLEK
jgi:hypothetical protein